MQSSSLYVTDGDEIDWAYGRQRIWMYTFELYPSHAKVSSDAALLPGRRAHRARDEAQQGRDPLPHRARRVPRTTSSARPRTNCGPLFDDFEIATRLDVGPARAPTRRRPAPGSGPIPATTTSSRDTVLGLARRSSPGPPAGIDAKRYDVDGGDHDDPRHRSSTLPTATIGSLTFRYYFAHASNSSSADYFRAYVEREDGSRTLVRQELGAGQRRQARLGDGHRVDGAVGRREGPDRVRGGRRVDRRARSRPPSTTSGSRARRRGQSSSAWTRCVPRAGRGRHGDPARRAPRRGPWRSPGPSPEPRDVSPFTNRSKTCGQQLRGDARTGVGDPQRHEPRVRGVGCPATVTAPAGRRVAERVRDQVREHLARSRTGSTSRIGRSSVVSSVSVTPAAAAAAANERTTSAMTRSSAVGSRWSASVPASDRVERPKVVDEPLHDAGSRRGSA